MRRCDLPQNDVSNAAVFQVRAIEMFTITDMMFVNGDTLASLQIIQSESHPNSHMQGPHSTGAKESLSVYGLFYHLARTPQGKQKLRQVFLQPSTSLSIIEERLDAISVLLLPENAPSLDTLCKSLKMVKDIRTVIIHLQKGVSAIPHMGSAIRSGVWANIQNFTFHTLAILEALRELNHKDKLGIANKVSSRSSILARELTS